MDPPPGGPLQEISINRIKGHRKILQKRESQNITKSPTKSPRKFTDSIDSVVEVHGDEVKAPEKENNCYSKSPLTKLVPDIPVTRCISNVQRNGACKILNKSVKDKENIPLTVCPSPETLNGEQKSFSKDSSTAKKPITEFLVTSILPQASGITQISDGNKATELAKQDGIISDKSELTSIDVNPENQYSRTISIGNVEVVVLGESVIISSNQKPQQIETSTITLPSIDGTRLIQTHEQTQTNLSAPDSSTDGSDGQTRRNSNSSGIKLVSSEPDSSLADNYLGTITDSESSASETSFSSSPVSSASVTNLALLPTSTSKGFPKPLNEQLSTDNKPVSSGIAVTSSVFQSVSSQASYCKGSQRAPLSRRNARERNRVRLVSQGFAILRQHVPQAARRKKLSKVETLRCAVDYIKALSRMIEENNASNNLVPSPSNSSTLCNSFGTLNETNQKSSFQFDSSRVKHERDEHRHPLHEGLQRQHLQTMLPIDSSCLLNASMLSKHREQCLQIAPSRHHKDGTDFSSAPGVSSSNAMLTPRVFNLPLNEPDVLGCQFIEFPCNPDLTYVPAALCASTSSVPTIQTLSQAPQTATSAAPISRYAMPTITSIVPNTGDVPKTTPAKITPLIAPTNSLVSISSTVTNTAPTLNAPLNHIPPNVISTLHHTSPSVVSTLYKPSPTISSTTDLTSPTISCTSIRSHGVLSEDSYSSSPIHGVSALMDNQEELFDGDETDDAELMDCLSWWQETP